MPSMFQLRQRLFIKRGILILVFLAVAGGIYFGLQSSKFDELKKKIFPTDKSADLTEEEKKANLVNGFDAFLERANVQQLILKSTELVDSPRENVLVRLERQNKKIRVAEKLMQQTSDSRTTNIGIKSKLTALQTRELINFDNGLSSVESLGELDQFAAAYMGNTDQDVKRNVSLGLLQTTIFLDLLNSQSDGSGMKTQTLEKFDETSETYVDDSVAGNVIFGFLKRIHIHASADDYAKFVSAFKSRFENSDVAQLKTLAVETSATLVESEFELENIFDSIDSLRNEAVQKLAGQIKQALSQNFVSENGYRRIYESIQDIASVRSYDVAAKLSGLLQKRIEDTSALADLSDANNRSIKRLNLVNGPLDLTGLTTLEEQPFSFRNENAKLRALVFMSKTSFDRADVVLFKLLKTTNRFIKSKQFSLTPVLIDDGNSEKQIRDIKNVDSKVAIVDFVKLKSESAKGKALLERMSLDDFPAVLLLNQRNEVVGVDIAIDDFERQFFELMDSNSD